MKKTIFTILTVILTASGAFAADSTDAARGVNPADNLTKLELLPQLRAVGDSSISSLTFKYDRAIRRVFGINAEFSLFLIHKIAVSI